MLPANLLNKLCSSTIVTGDDDLVSTRRGLLLAPLLAALPFAVSGSAADAPRNWSASLQSACARKRSRWRVVICPWSLTRRRLPASSCRPPAVAVDRLQPASLRQMPMISLVARAPGENRLGASLDGGQSWQVLATDQADSTITLPSGGPALVEVQASDGVRTDTRTYTVPAP